ncbi:3'(2'),5'-bisphosphate nucleotidase CysQ [Cellvibrio japonicus]|uniref:3'(2'),5'-bisphosphate nucleotidase CysQ n=1 Tax=Cellvibrio japonicus (strain Ueda107) TaxID=498211 RepID=B3PHB5_CELJU|nr:3'(2'),5'-bisphosphate nucleotidase CysQ [Cellvibrio japonicus]ACE83972.1 3'(2'),5'-bisphosphate nucleotidase [Cellvibrio japonicus Ueda107]QEI11034.1 3'(2'),5'-bisphosphate nucleotidase CysQ [Cellvibrio japonicus]QEI14609.1 3'(2'),5'-bisphosphate nucleotidase CysQ [Cellvibrio japonicus]QEI18188.1 3'(2'),5'-bisphosphate nucleotidase CysQ [Cellvibrio japonicus]
MSPVIDAALVRHLLAIGRDAGAAIMAIYRDKDSHGVVHKADDSPLTAADLAAQAVIASRLAQLLDLPIVSEEAQIPAFAERSRWESYWLVDPLDGTREFVAGNGEFTVNIALVHAGRPILGLVHVPVTDITYLGILAEAQPAGAWKYQGDGTPQAIRTSDINQRLSQGLPLRVLLSHRHGTSATLGLVEQLARAWPGGIVRCNAGSSLKFCVIAEGGADFYPRLAPTSEWDTAAAQAVLEAAGGAVVEAMGSDAALQPLRYNQRDELLNPYFYGLADGTFAWQSLLMEGRL